MRAKLLAFLAVASIFAGCKKDFDLDLSADNKNFLVVEGQITNQTEPQYVKLTRTLSYLNNSTPASVNDATVFVQVGDDTIRYHFVKEGIYLAPESFIGEIGKTYKLTILVDDKQYTATSTMFPPHYITNLHTRKSIFSDDHYDVLCDLTSNSADEEFMLFRCEVDGKFYPAIEDVSFASNGNLGEGTFKDVQLYYTEYTDQKEITVYTYTIDKAFYKFLRAAENALDEPSPVGTPPGASIPGNISGDALGFFFAASVTKESAKVVMK